MYERVSGADQDVLELDHPGIREEEGRVARRDEARAGHGRMPALGEELDEPATDLGGGQRHDPRIWGLDGGGIGRNGTQPLVSGDCNAALSAA